MKKTGIYDTNCKILSTLQYSNHMIKRDFHDTSVRLSAHKVTGVLVGQPASADWASAD